MLQQTSKQIGYDTEFAEAAKGFFKGKGLPGVYTYSSPEFESDLVDGARYFSEFIETPTYYPKRNELALLPTAAPQILRIAGYFNVLVDLGCGEAFASKVKHFIGDADYAPVDMNWDYLDEVTEQCTTMYPDKTVTPAQLDFLNDPLHFDGKPFPVMLGCTITNFGTPDSVRQIFRQVKPLLEQGNGSFVFTHDTNTHKPTLDKTYMHELMQRHTLNVLYRIKRDLNTENFDPTRFGCTAVWDASTSTYNICMYPTEDMSFAIDGEWFSLKKDEILPQAPLMKLPAEQMFALAKAEGFDHHEPIYDSNEGHIALQHVHL